MKKKPTPAKKPANRRVRVTVWTHPDWDMKLVLEGTIMKTIGKARSYLGDSPTVSSTAKLKGESDYMFRNVINEMPVFEG